MALGSCKGGPLPVLGRGLWSQRGEGSGGAPRSPSHRRRGAGAEECCPISEGVGWRGCLHPRSRRGGDGGSWGVRGPALSAAVRCRLHGGMDLWVHSPLPQTRQGALLEGLVMERTFLLLLPPVPVLPCPRCLKIPQCCLVLREIRMTLSVSTPCFSAGWFCSLF